MERNLAMICLTGGERTGQELAQRLSMHPHVTMQEVRLDLLERIDDGVIALLRSPRVVATCRHASEGGGFRGTRRDQYEILQRALCQKPGWIDVEASLPREFRDALFAQRGETRFVLSWHRFEPGATDLPGAVEQEPADVIKVALGVQDVVDVERLLDLWPEARRPVVRIAMGEGGWLTRALYKQLGSPWTYVVADGADTVAPGQFTLSTARQWRMDVDGALTPLGLVGGSNVHHSPGPRVYNRLFSVLNLPLVYVPVMTHEPERILRVLERFGFGGCSVTMPAKRILATQVDELCGHARETGAVNTVRFKNGRRIGFNTDVDAVAALLERWRGDVALVLGSGGAASAAVVGLKMLGCRVSISARNTQSAQALGSQLEVQVVPWGDRGSVPFRVLVNATPCGSDGCSDPMPDDVDWTGRAVLDAVLTSEATPLLRRAALAGATTMGGSAWWVAQGRAQMKILADVDLTAEQMHEALHG